VGGAQVRGQRHDDAAVANSSRVPRWQRAPPDAGPGARSFYGLL
jgi:hypothetical protein